MVPIRFSQPGTEWIYQFLGMGRDQLGEDSMPDTLMTARNLNRFVGPFVIGTASQRAIPR